MHSQRPVFDMPTWRSYTDLAHGARGLWHAQLPCCACRPPSVLQATEQLRTLQLRPRGLQNRKPRRLRSQSVLWRSRNRNDLALLPVQCQSHRPSLMGLLVPGRSLPCRSSGRWRTLNCSSSQHLGGTELTNSRS
jgi:hypothetical protein